MTTSTELRRLRVEAVTPLAQLRQQIDVLLSAISSGSRDIESVLLHDADSVSNLTYIVKLIEVVPGVGKVGARQVLSAVDVLENDLAGNLTVAQRTNIVQRVQSLIEGRS
ncbi:MAG: hypothetical protein D4R95_06630 [Actinobacteria bacterium]|nr:MAG: hypothetical protein D4R95_06630 [Actinomycetota bacterium]